ncbi:collagen-like protein [Pedobacter helvus]|uniref:Collagen-like protein n=1 Tax=Pedobacter helvus TaxID=2563444 RepID=A0ABW9JI86_9SPHI|nr:collagen-like protein [Pedobacter ureilyticus]
MTKYFTLLIFAAVLGFTACKKGENGVDGAKGEKGEQGLKGTDGSTMHSGTGAPANTLGNIGDFYLDKNTAELYGPKTATAWPSPISLKGSNGAAGATGAAGTPGSKILSGTTVPAVALGAEGDFYFDTVNLAFYGPKTSASWGSAISLKATNAVTTFLYNNQSFDNVVLENSYTNTYQIPNFTTYMYNGIKTLNISHATYQNAYNTGVIFVRLKFSNDNNNTWGPEINKGSGDYNLGSYNYISIGGDDDMDDEIIKASGIIIEGDQETSTDPSGSGLKNLKFDVKVVCIPAGTVIQMANKNIDVKNAEAVAKYLEL